MITILMWTFLIIFLISTHSIAYHSGAINEMKRTRRILYDWESTLNEWEADVRELNGRRRLTSSVYKRSRN